MRYLTSLVAATTLVTSVFSHPSLAPGPLSGNNAVNHNRLTKRIVTGATGNVHPRLEIRQMQREQPDQWNLLLLAMAEWQKAEQSDESGYYGVSTIHGVPRQDYDGVGHGDCEACDDSDGYCTHDSVLFPAWHRTYVALYEQNWIAACNKVAETFTGSQRTAMVEAASTIRWPYWDWAADPGSDSTTLPSLLTAAQVTVNGPSGQQTVANPLLYHHFSNTSNLIYSPFTTWENTLRYPSSNNPAATSNEQSATNAFTNIRPNLQDQIYQLMSACDEYLLMSNDDSSSASSSCANSLEAIHNTVHTTCGGPGGGAISAGHMTYLPLAAFDPIFWFHHANVDRFFAIWQTLHPDSYGATQIAPHNTWTIAQGSSQGPDSPLTPFRKDASTFWTTNDVRDFETTFKYTYPEISSTGGNQAEVEELVAALYGPSATLTAGSVPTGAGASSDSGSGSGTSIATSSVSSSTSAPSGSSTSLSSSASTSGAPSGGVLTSRPTSTPKYSNQTTPSPHPYTANNGSSYQYVCNVDTPRYGLNGSYTVYFFNGQPTSEQSSEWITDVHLIGIVGVLAGGNMNMTGVRSISSIPLTRTLQNLVKSGILKDMSEEVCVPYMKEHLTWRILTTRGNVVNPAEIEGFAASVYSSTTSQKNKYSLPQWSGFVQQVDVTKDKAGGANETITYPNASQGSQAQQSPSYGSAAPSYGYAPSSSSVPGYEQPSPSVTSSSLPEYDTPTPSDDVATVIITHYTTVCACPKSSSLPTATGY